MEVAVVEAARLRLLQAAVVVQAQPVGAAGADRPLGSAAAEATGRGQLPALAAGNGSEVVARAGARGSSMAVRRGFAGTMEQTGEIPDRAFAIAVAIVVPRSATGPDGATMVVGGATIVAMCAGTGAIIRGVRVSRSGSTMATTTAIAVG